MSVLHSDNLSITLSFTGEAEEDEEANCHGSMKDVIGCHAV